MKKIFMFVDYYIFILLVSFPYKIIDQYRMIDVLNIIWFIYFSRFLQQKFSSTSILEFVCKLVLTSVNGK